MASWLETLAMSNAWESRPMSEVAVTSARPAVARGSSEDSSAPPKTSSRMTSAAATATTTDIPMLGRSEVSMDWPPREMCTSGPSADSAAAISLPASAVVTWVEGLSQVTRAKAMVPSRLIGAAPAAVMSMVTCGAHRL